MDSKALYNISYGVFILGTKNSKKINACITNTCIQVASSPIRIAISLLNSNFSCDMLKETKLFTLSVLDKRCKFEIIKRFGYQSGKNVDKFNDFEYKTDSNGLPYVESCSCSVLSCRVVSFEDLGTHTLFIAQIDDAFLTSKEMPLTYADYQNELKPKTSISPTNSTEKKIVGWRCKICGYEYKGAQLPSDFVCPICGHSAEDFEPIYE